MNGDATITNERTVVGVLGVDKSGDGGFGNVLVGDDSLARERRREVAPD